MPDDDTKGGAIDPAAYKLIKFAREFKKGKPMTKIEKLIEAAKKYRVLFDAVNNGDSLYASFERAEQELIYAAETIAVTDAEYDAILKKVRRKIAKERR